MGAVNGKPLLATLVVGSVLAGCSSVSYNSDFDPQLDFTSYETYAWLEPADEQATRGRGPSPLVEKRIVSEIDEALDAKGFRKATSRPPDFLVNFLVTTQQKIDFDSYYVGWGYYGWYGGTQVSARQWTEGTIIIDVIDAKSKELAWRGWATAAVDPDIRQEERNRRIREVVQGTLKPFPPGS